MKLYEYEGAELFVSVGINIAPHIVLEKSVKTIALKPPVVIKAQIHSGDRRKKGGIVFAITKVQAVKAVNKMLKSTVDSEPVKSVMVAQKLDIAKEYYVSLSYDTATRGPVLAVSTKGGSGISKAQIFPIDLTVGLPGFLTRQHLSDAGFPSEDILRVAGVIEKLYQLFLSENLVLAEINPLVKTKAGEFVAVDSKVITKTRRQVEYMGGDIAILASGGGASILNIDALLSAGGSPANYTEYSGNPKAEVVTELTKQVLSQHGIKGCWVVGGTANFTDIYETLRGFVEGLRQVKPKPTYPIVIRRDGPRQKEAVAMLKEVGEKEGYDFHVYGSETPMVKTAKIIVDLVKRKK